MEAIVEITRNVTRGSVGGGEDLLDPNPVVDILEVSQGATIFREGVDRQQSGNHVDWLGSGNEPAIGTTYRVRWIYTKQMIKGTDYVDSGWFGQASHPAAGNYFYLVTAYNASFFGSLALLPGNETVLVEMSAVRPRISTPAPSPCSRATSRFACASTASTGWCSTPRRQQEIDTPRFGRPTGDWDLIYEELAIFTDPQRDLPPIDQLEGFRPDSHSMYQRVAVLCGRTSIPAWTYWMPRIDTGIRLGSGIWHRPC